MRPTPTPGFRWRRLSTLLAALERAVAGAARLEAYVPLRSVARGRPRLDARLAFDARLRALEDRVDQELDRLTAELLAARLIAQRQRQQPDFRMCDTPVEPVIESVA